VQEDGLGPREIPRSYEEVAIVVATPGGVIEQETGGRHSLEYDAAKSLPAERFRHLHEG
jgi:hypothetical protein